MVFNSNAITRIQSAILASIIIFAAVAGILSYVLWNTQDTSETIKIGVLADWILSMEKVFGKVPC